MKLLLDVEDRIAETGGNPTSIRNNLRHGEDSTRRADQTTIPIRGQDMLKKFARAAIVSLGGLAAVQAFAGTTVIHVSQDTGVWAGSSNSTNTLYDWVGHSGGYAAFSLFGFDTSSLAGQTITDITFTAYHNYDGGASHVSASTSTAAWSESSVTDAFLGTLGSQLSTVYASSSNVGQWQTWDLGSGSYSGSYLTVALQDLNNGWNDYAPTETGYGAYLTITTVPEPANLALLGAGAALLLAASRRKAR